MNSDRLTSPRGMAMLRMRPMQLQKTRIIDAREEHVPFIAWVQLTAFRSRLPKGMWDLFLGGPEEDSLRFLETIATTQTRHWGSYQGFIIAEVDGTPAAAMPGYFDAESSFEEGIAEACRTAGMTQDDITLCLPGRCCIFWGSPCLMFAAPVAPSSKDER